MNRRTVETRLGSEQKKLIKKGPDEKVAASAKKKNFR